ncbi:chorismate synthase [Propionispira arboris]|uniref:Chorismate synthase n=1 Tax=Propionispira arboris TaxID=84035 RepID=A0A1H6VYZ7_9FIRM|nr:chorismate synthase [Propionispira arboris]SEJ08956.1 chorismate synthase [Propionispira arboris]
MFRFLTAGESHGQCLTAIVEGMPAGLTIDVDQINKDMARRQQGYGRGGRMLIETDKMEILSGVRFGETMGDPVTVKIANKDWENWTGRMSVSGKPEGPVVTAARPGHADLTGIKKYDRKDIRDILERSSARETAARVAVGGLAKQLLKACGIKIVSQVTNIGGIQIDEANIAYDTWGENLSELNCCDAIAEEKMKEKIRQAKTDGDTLGGIFEIAVLGVMPGLGSHIQWDRRLDARISGALMSIQAIKGVEIGAGFEYANLPGSLAHDEIFLDESQHVYRKTNHAGGIEGGMSNGEAIVVRVVMKPIPTLMKPLRSIDIKLKEAVLACKERSDVCAVSAASVVGEAMTAIVVAQELLEKFGGDSIGDLKAAIAHYQKRI